MENAKVEKPWQWQMVMAIWAARIYQDILVKARRQTVDVLG